MSRSTRWYGGVGDASPDRGNGGPRYRSLPVPGTPADQVGAQGWRLGDLLLPALTLRRSAVEHNVALHAAWCQQVGVSHAPHAKTHLSPEIVRLQLRAGAWGMTAASVHQARLLAGWDVTRVILAHQVVDQANMRALARLRQQRPGLTVLPLVDSVDGVSVLARSLHGAGATRPLPVLVEFGLPGGRTGARSVPELERVARAVRDSLVLTLAGVEGFEGVLPVGRDSESVARVDGYIGQLVESVARLDGLGLFDGTDEVLLTAGGSIFPDRVATARRPVLSRPLRLVVRSGGTVTHDYGAHAGAQPLAPEASHPLGALRPALELWAAVVSIVFVTDGRYESRYPPTPVDVGATAVVQVGRYLHVVVTERPASQLDYQLYLHVGLDPRDAGVIVTKSAGAYRGFFEPIAAECIDVDTRGPSDSRIDLMPFTGCPARCTRWTPTRSSCTRVSPTESTPGSPAPSTKARTAGDSLTAACSASSSMGWCALAIASPAGQMTRK